MVRGERHRLCRAVKTGTLGAEMTVKKLVGGEKGDFNWSIFEEKSKERREMTTKKDEHLLVLAFMALCCFLVGGDGVVRDFLQCRVRASSCVEGDAR